MKLLLEVYGIPQKFLEENNQLIEYAKKNGIDNNFMFDNLFKDIKTYINEKNNKRKKSIFSFNKNSMSNDKGNEAHENVDDDGDLIIESESEEEVKNNNFKDEKEVNKDNKHCTFDSKKNKEIIYLKNEDIEKDKDGIGKMIDDINRKAEKGIKIGEKTIFSNYKGIKEHSFIINNNNNYINNREKNKIDSNMINENSLNRNNLIVNKSLELSKDKERKNEKDIIINRNNILITNSKISTDIFMNALNFCNNDNKNTSNVQNNNKDNSDYLTKVNVSKINKKNINIFDEPKINMNKENQFNEIKENESDKNYKIENIEKDNNINKYNSNIGNIHDLDNFDDLFK
jgi:hypothetical protein